MISKKRVRALNNYLWGISEENRFYVGIKVSDVTSSRLEKAGFVKDMAEGELLLPCVIGPVSRFNANGGFEIHRDREMETCYREAYIKGWHDIYYFVTIPYKRYPRTPILAPNVELMIADVGGEKLILSPVLVKNIIESKKNTHVINLFLELFGECEIYKEDFAPALSNIPLKKVNWEILPSGTYVWDRVKDVVGKIIDYKKKHKAVVIERNIEVISKYKPSGLIVGRGGFKGYLVFEFPSKKLYVLENLIYGNATYILGNDYEELSKLTKGQIIGGELHEARLVHRQGWDKMLEKHLQ